jgi:hypothetical protein
MPLRPVSELGLVDITDVPPRGGNRTATRSRSTHARSRPSQPLRSDSANDRPTETRNRPREAARASTRRKSDAGRRTSKSLAVAPQPSAPGKSGRSGVAKRHEPRQSRATSAPKLGSAAPATAENSGGKSNRARSSTTSSERSRSRSRAARDTGGSGGSTRSATASTQKRSSGSASAPRRVRTVRRQASAGSRTKRNHASREAQRSRDGGAPGQMKPRAAAKVGISVVMGASLVAGGLLLARAALHR